MMPASRAFVHSDALWTRSCGAEETRTPDFLLAKEALYQLSYGPTRRSRVERSATERSGPDAWLLRVRAAVGASGLEPETSALSGQCSNQLS